jgi:hypothetical protein
MAKQLVGPVERHVDKVVLGIAGVVLIAVVAKFLVTSPNKLEIRNEMVSPSSIDLKVREFAQSVRQTIRAATPPDHEVEVLGPVFDASAAPIPADDWPTVAALLPEVPLVGPPVVIEGDIRLISAPAPGKPRVVAGRSTFYLPPPEGVSEGDELQFEVPANWATVSSVVNVDQLRILQRDHYLPDREEVYFTRVEIQRQKLNADGSWPEDWDDVAPYLAFVEHERPQPPEIALTTEEDRITVSHIVMTEIEGYFNELKRPSVQLDILRPRPPEMVTETYWSLPVVTTRMDVLRMDDQYLYPEEKPTLNPDDRYPDAPIEVEAPTGDGGKEAGESLQDANRRRFKQADDLYSQGDRENSIDLVTQAQNVWLEIIAAIDATGQKSPQSDIDRAQKLRRDAEQLKLDIRRRLLRPQQTPQVPGGAPVAVLRPQMSTQQVWVHDALAGSLQSGTTYRYRLRVWLYNRMAGLPNLLAEPADATVPMVATEWSEPSKPVEIPPDRRYFLASAYNSRNEIGIEFYQWFEGVWTKPRGTEKFAIGDVMSFLARAPLPRRDDPEEVDNAELRFFADATLLDIEFDMPSPERARTRNRGFQFEDQPDTVAAFVDSDGHVFERSLNIDKSHPDRTAARERAWTAPRKLSSAPTPTPGQSPGKSPTSRSGTSRGSQKRSSRDRP